MIQDKDGKAVKTMADWQGFYLGPKEKHWKEGRSAYAIADYILNRNGLDNIRQRLAEIYQQDISFTHGIPEQEIQFDSFGKGRVHDLGLHGITQTLGDLFVGIEAKVDEKFGPTIIDAYLDGKIREIEGIPTGAPQRIENLLKLHFPKPHKSVFNLRYQLLYATQGTIAAGADKSVLYILVFKTDLYNDLKGIENFRDYITFLNALNAEELECSRSDSRVHRLLIGEKELISIYEQVDLESKN